MEGTMAVVTCFAADFAPRFWSTCDGQILNIASNQALFSLLGTTYGGDGVSTFALPDLRGRAPVSAGQGPGLSNYNLGQPAGAEFATLNAGNLPQHNHNGNIALEWAADSSDGSTNRAVNSFPAVYAGAYATNPGNKLTMAAPAYNVTIENAGGGQPIDIRSPFLAVVYIICLAGIYPSRN